MTIELFDPTKNYAAAQGHLTYRGGPLLQHARLVGVFVDDFALASEMAAFLDWYGTSSLVTELAEYNITGPATHFGDVHLSLSPVPTPVPTPPPPGPPPVPVPPPNPPPVPTPHPRPKCPPGCRSVHHRSVAEILHVLRTKDGLHRAQTGSTVVTDAHLQGVLTDAITRSVLPKPDGALLFVLFLPDGVTVQQGGDLSCQSFCGYHNSYELPDRTDVFYAVLTYPSCAGCLGGLSAFDALTATTSHEIAESLTDPQPGLSWYSDSDGEIGDICAWTFRQEGPYTVQKEWSNQRGSCI